MQSYANGSGGKAAPSLSWVEKYRPTTLGDVVAHEEILSTLRLLMESDSMPHLLFYGPPGTGKTSTIKACAHQLYGRDRVRGNVLEMNASDDRGIDVVRNQIREFSSTTSIFSSLGAARGAGEAPWKAVPFKLVVLDEADQMSHDAQAALRRVIEKYTKNVRFCVLCNHINKIIPAVQSRCTRFRFAPVKKSAMIPRLQVIAEAEGVPYTAEGLAAAFRLSQGDLRRCLNTMQAAALSFNEITETSMYRVTGNPTREEVSGMVSSMLSSDLCTSYASVLSATTLSGVSVMDLVREMHPIVMSMDLPLDCKCFLLKTLADLEYYAAGGAREACGLGGLVGAFQLVKESVTQRKPMREVLTDF